MSEVVFHRLDHDRVMGELTRYAEQELGARPEVAEVVLIGSLARGDWTARSDADVVVVVDEADERGPFRGPDYAPREPLTVSVDAFVYTPDETAGWSPRFRAEVERGIVLHRRGTTPVPSLAEAELTAPERRVIDRFVEALERRLGDDLRTVWLYGSRARGERAHDDSDVDLLIVTEAGSSADRDVVNELICEVAWDEEMNPFAFSTIVWSPGWLRGRREIRSFFVQEVDRDKIVLHGER